MNRATDLSIANVNLKLFDAFLLVAEHLSFREVAEATGKSQSAISAQIKQLEAQVGVPLFRRTTRQVSITSEGKALLTHVRRSMDELQLGLRELKASVNAKRQRVSFACSPFLASTYGSEILSRFSKRYPHIDVIVQEVGSDGLLDSVRRGECAFAIGGAGADPLLRVDVFLDDPFFALIPAKLADRKGTTIALRDLARLPLVLLKSKTPTRTLLEDHLRKQKIVVDTHYEFTLTQTVIRMVEGGLGATVLPSHVLPTALKSNLRAKRLVEPEMTRKIAMITVRGHTLNEPEAFLASTVKRLIRPYRG